MLVRVRGGHLHQVQRGHARRPVSAAGRGGGPGLGEPPTALHTAAAVEIKFFRIFNFLDLDARNGLVRWLGRGHICGCCSCLSVNGPLLVLVHIEVVVGDVVDDA